MRHEDQVLITLGALLHDIGKFRERTFEPLPAWAEGFRREARYSHEPCSALFVEEQLSGWPLDAGSLRRLVLKHHGPELHDELLVSLADRLSANERAEAEGDTEGARGRAETTLRTVLSRVQWDGRSAEGPRYHTLRALSFEEDALFPHPEMAGSAAAYRALWQDFAAEMARVPRGDVVTLLALLHKYTWAIPSDTRRDIVPDISLYHHLKTTAAIAACLVREGLAEDEVRTLYDALTRLFKKEPLTPREAALLERPLCALVKGDISGTQDFLYLLTSSGAARGLRGRSFYLQLLTEVIAHWLLRRFALPPVNLLFAGGGHFYLLLPYQETVRQLDGLRQEIARKLWAAHRGDLFLTVDFVPVAARDFLEEEAGGNAFATKWDEVSRRVGERKQRKWADLGPEAMHENLFTARQAGTTAADTCQVCHNEGTLEVEEGVRKCQHCRGFEDLGKRLRQPTHLVLFTVAESEPPPHGDWRHALRAFGAEAWLVQADEAVPRPTGATAATVYVLDTVAFLSEEVVQRFRWGDLPVSYDFRLLAGATPLKRGDNGEEVIAEFSDLAKASQGVEWLGVLRMDVDSLGEVFRRGLGKEATISRMSTLSESLRLFFEAWVPRVCREYNSFSRGKEDTLYLIYAGGDDLFLVGAWSVLPEVARRLRDDFRRFVGGDHVTLSGGIAIEHQKFPLYQLANNAKDTLDNAKYAKALRRPDGRAKDALCFLQTPLGWEQFAEVAQWKEKLQAMLQNGAAALPRAFLTRLSEIYALYEENAKYQRRLQRQGQATLAQIEEAIQYDRWRWRLVYQLSRFGERYPAHNATIEALGQAILRESQGLIALLHVLARWVALLTREE